MRKTAFTLVAAAALFGASDASAQTVGASAQIVIPQLLHINITSGAAVAFPALTVDNWNDGFVAASASTVVNTRSNVAHSVTVEADAATMADGPYAKSAGDLQWSITDGGTYTGLSTTAATVRSGLTAGNNAGAATVFYRMLLDETTDGPGTYNLAFTYTVVAN